MNVDNWLLQDCDIRKELRNIVDRLLQKGSISLEAKIQGVQILTETYIKRTGEKPDSNELDRLSAWILKGMEKEVGIKSDRQLRRIWQEKEFMYAIPEDREFDMSCEGHRRKSNKSVL